VLEGRWGPYVTDGATNASLLRGVAPYDLELEQAVELLRAREARGPAKKKAPVKKAAKKTTPAKKAATKRAVAKKAPRKTAKKTAG